MPDITDEQRAKIGAIKTQWRHLIERAVDELLERPDYVDRAQRPVVGFHTDAGALHWWGSLLDTPE